MPFTPFHFGLGAAVKAAAPRHFSFSVFAFAQVLTDTEVLVHMASQHARLHQHFHTPVGALIIGVISIVVGRPVCQWFLRWWSSDEVPYKDLFNPSPDISLFAASTGAFFGTFSHVALDAIMHSDVRPFAPWIDQNLLHGLLNPGAVHAICFLLGALGVILCATWRKHDL